MCVSICAAFADNLAQILGFGGLEAAAGDGAAAAAAGAGQEGGGGNNGEEDAENEEQLLPAGFQPGDFVPDDNIEFD